MIKVGDIYSETFSISESQVDKFAELSGDYNPLHISDEIAKKSIFGQRVVHGILGASKISKVLGVNFPGEGTIYLNQTLSFNKPIFPNDQYTIKLVIKSIKKDKGVLTISTTIFDKNEDVVIDGEAVVLNKNC